MELAFVKYIIGMNLVNYILADDVFGMNAILADFGSLLVTVYMIAILIISLFETVILYNINHIYKRKIIPLLGEKI